MLKARDITTRTPPHRKANKKKPGRQWSPGKQAAGRGLQKWQLGQQALLLSSPHRGDGHRCATLHGETQPNTHSPGSPRPPPPPHPVNTETGDRNGGLEVTAFTQKHRRQRLLSAGHDQKKYPEDFFLNSPSFSSVSRRAAEPGQAGPGRARAALTPGAGAYRESTLPAVSARGLLPLAEGAVLRPPRSPGHQPLPPLPPSPALDSPRPPPPFPAAGASRDRQGGGGGGGCRRIRRLGRGPSPPALPRQQAPGVGGGEGSPRSGSGPSLSPPPAPRRAAPLLPAGPARRLGPARIPGAA